ncbi:MAG: hypothetical protein LH616_03710 [Ilumatobacteraceae bacterium]|nr:hypothetical protein [Ilumatobacteraceae bacterium]
MNIRRTTIATAIIAAIGLSACRRKTKRAIDSGITIATVDPAAVTTVVGDATTVPEATVAPVTAVPATAPAATRPRPPSASPASRS